MSWEDPLEEGMAADSSILAWIIPWTEEPGKLQTMGSQGVGWQQQQPWWFDMISNSLVYRQK